MTLGRGDLQYFGKKIQCLTVSDVHVVMRYITEVIVRYLWHTEQDKKQSGPLRKEEQDTLNVLQDRILEMLGSIDRADVGLLMCELQLFSNEEHRKVVKSLNDARHTIDGAPIGLALYAAAMWEFMETCIGFLSRCNQEEKAVLVMDPDLHCDSLSYSITADLVGYNGRETDSLPLTATQAA